MHSWPWWEQWCCSSRSDNHTRLVVVQEPTGKDLIGVNPELSRGPACERVCVRVCVSSDRVVFIINISINVGMDTER